MGGTAKTRLLQQRRCRGGSVQLYGGCGRQPPYDGIAIGENKIDLDDGTIEDDARNQPRGISKKLNSCTQCIAACGINSTYNCVGGLQGSI